MPAFFGSDKRKQRKEGDLLFFKAKQQNNNKGQLAFKIEKTFEKDRNFQQGGRSFYFFDFDENIAFLDTTVILFHKLTQKEKSISGREFSHHQKNIGVRGPYQNYKLIYEDSIGSFRNYRDHEIPGWLQFFGKEQSLIKDMKSILSTGETHWQGPSWSCFYHAVFNRRPIALITARGHAPETLKSAIRLWVKYGFLPHEPNYLGIYPVNFPETKKTLMKNTGGLTVSQLKKRAIKHAFAKAIETYGQNPHRIGMSDDDPGNVSLITEAMQELKVDHPQVSFFVIDTAGGQFVKKELGPQGQNKKPSVPPLEQLQLGPEVDNI